MSRTLPQGHLYCSHLRWTDFKWRTALDRDATVDPHRLHSCRPPSSAATCARKSESESRRRGLNAASTRQFIQSTTHLITGHVPMTTRITFL